MSFQPITQDYNDEQMDLLSVHFWKRNEPNVAWRHAVSSVMALPALRAFWPMSSVDYTVANRARDVSGGGYHLSDNNTVTFGYDQLAPYAGFDGINQYLDRADGGAANWADITGAETYVAPKAGGLTLGGWFYFDNATGAAEGLMSKWGATNATRAYRLIREAVGNISMGVRTISPAVVVVNSTATPGAGAWIFAVGRFVPGASVDVYVNADKDTRATAETTIQDVTTSFFIGNINALYLAGRASMCWLCASALSDSIIMALFQQQRKMYNV